MAAELELDVELLDELPEDEEPPDESDEEPPDEPESEPPESEDLLPLAPSVEPDLEEPELARESFR
ncbi:hypothetical protein GCM10023169_14130 [Georgenia halophila]|uniref:Uncharacterized protein n=1 Tax=Georgenia halophila TaxID=620889 RepID=A0ABP8L257_9MICO